MPNKRSIAGIAIKDYTVFVAKRLPGGDLGGKWEFPGGKLEAGEDDCQALVREYGEEFGVPITVGEKLGESSFSHKNDIYKLAAYLIFFSDQTMRLNEHEAARWLKAEDLVQLDLADSDRTLLPFVLPLLIE